MSCRNRKNNIIIFVFAYQSERKGTAHAVMMADAFLKEHSGGDVLILNGDAPLVDEAVIRASYEQHKKNRMPLL